MSPSHSSPQKNPLEDDLKDDLEKVARDALLPGLGADKARIQGLGYLWHLTLTWSSTSDMDTFTKFQTNPNIGRPKWCFEDVWGFQSIQISPDFGTAVQAKKLLAACVAETSLLSAIYWICCSYALLGHEVDSERRRSVFEALGHRFRLSHWPSHFDPFLRCQFSFNIF